LADIEILKEADLDPVPGFYESLTNNPVAEIIRDGNVYNSLVRLKKFFDYRVTIEGRQLISPPGIFVAGLQTVTGNHNIKEGEIFGYVYTPLVVDLVGLRPLRYDDTSFSIQIGNFNPGPKTIEFRIYFFQILKKKFA
jgi:hypothetical protein